MLNKRKLIEKTKKTQRIIYLTEKGKKLNPKAIVELEQVSKITSEMLTSDAWKKVELKPFDVTKPGPLLKAGKIHPIINLINEIREVFLSMGFTEIRGPIVESAFFNFDALFQPQDHPARELQDTFYLNNPKEAKLPERKVDRVFRNERVDKSHLAEFTQIEGIVIDDNLNLCDLIGLLTEFYQKLGFSKIVTRPGFFPYTEPSMEVSVYYDKLGEWLEMGGSGIFRPEVTYPFGIKEPTRVLAWGQGLERIAMPYYGRDDIRDFYVNPIKWLRHQSYLK
ncbi:MAG: hypothetical protein P8Y23_01270 [Candidatus Lokiarchaeota archaeon]